MPQRRKISIQKRLLQAAREVFAERGYQAATIAEIAARAGISTGNVYRYVSSKEALFVEAVPISVPQTFLELTRARAAALSTSADLRSPDPASEHALLSARQLSFALDHRLEMIILLGRAVDGAPYADFRRTVHALLVELALDHARARRPGYEPERGERLALELAYDGLLVALVRIFERLADPADVRAAIDAYSRYHLVGLGSLFDGHR